MFYVYAYLRENGTPYYIGKGTKYRAWSKDHSINLPKDKNKIIIMESNLTELGSWALERRYIRWYGRKDNGTGILRNLTDGGEGGSMSEQVKQKISMRNKGQIPWSKGLNLTNEHKNRIGLSNKGKSKIAGEKNPKFGKGHLVSGINNPNAKIWTLLLKDGNVKIIKDLVSYCIENKLKYNTVYSWQSQLINGQQRLKKVENVN